MQPLSSVAYINLIRLRLDIHTLLSSIQFKNNLLQYICNLVIDLPPCIVSSTGARISPTDPSLEIDNFLCTYTYRVSNLAQLRMCENDGARMYRFRYLNWQDIQRCRTGYTECTVTNSF